LICTVVRNRHELRYACAKCILRFPPLLDVNLNTIETKLVDSVQRFMHT